MADDFLKQVWPEWEIEGNALGRGSFGVVYKGIRRDHNVESCAAIKVISIPADPSEVVSLRAEGMDAGSARTYFQGIVNDFVSEIQLMESLKGLQNIVSIEDYKVIEKSDEIGWDICIRMELLTPFNTYICDKKLTEQEVIRLGCDICTALEICNRCNIIHRDIKPENIFVNKFGSYKLGDFGIARKLENMTGGLSHKGAYNYMAPEVIYSTKYDARVDIYSLGIVLYRLLNGNRLPLLDNDQQLMNPSERRNAVERRLRGEQLPAPCDASPAMAAVILRACAFEPDARFATAAEMKQALLRVANGANEQADDKPDSVVPVYESPTAGDRSMYMPKTPPASRTPAEERGAELPPPLEDNEEDDDKPYSTVPVYESPTAGVRSMYMPKTPPASRTPAEEIDVETPPPLVGDKRKYGMITAVVMAILAIVFMVTQIIPVIRYNNAVALMEQGELAKAAITFGKLGDYKDAKARSFALWDKVAQRDTISVGDKHTVGLTADGTVVVVGNNGSGQCDVSSWKDIVAISAGNYHTVGLKSDGTVVAVGSGRQCDVSNWKDIVAISAGGFHTVGLKSDGTVVAVGSNKSGTCNVSDWKNIVAISAGKAHTVGLKSDGTVVAVGNKDYGECNVSGWSDIIAISAGTYHTVGLKSNGTVVAVGIDKTGRFSSWKDIVSISVGGAHTVGLKSDGTVVAVGEKGWGQCDVSSWKDIVSISVGGAHTVGLKSDGTVVAVGNNECGQCDVSGWKDIKLPQ